MTSWNYDLVAAFSIAVVKFNVQISIHADLQFSLDDVHPPAALFFPTAAVKKTHSGSDNVISYMLDISRHVQVQAQVVQQVAALLPAATNLQTLVVCSMSCFCFFQPK